MIVTFIDISSAEVVGQDCIAPMADHKRVLEAIRKLEVVHKQVD